ncbi:carbohydrate kinase family protein [Patescibacteria group bacterium]|nr:carbohydrate kinase family protein [Patescibacteria group bacterium]
MLFRRSKPIVDFIAIGDCVIDSFLQIEEASVACQLKREACQLCLPYGEKIPLAGIVRVAGAGNASNVAVGAARLGLQSHLYSVVGHDQLGQEIHSTWAREGVHTDLIQIDKVHPTNAHTVLTFQGERTILIYHEPRSYTLPKLPPVRWIYYTSLGHNHERVEQQLLAYLKQHPETNLLFQPGTFQLRRGGEALAPVIAKSTIIAVNKEEAQRILGIKTDSISTLLKGFHTLGSKIVVITDGKNGSYASDGTTSWFCPIFPGQSIEATGAGDSYTLGFLYAYDQTGSVPEAMRAGTGESWSVVQFIGPHAGLLTARRLKQVLKTYEHLQPVEYLDRARARKTTKKPLSQKTRKKT